ncbi:hypothetical protein [Cohnella boryungensis]|uniref:BclA C-terminal domain-containing protein n=1 Tax=Cohnella boryungensis TaxID=768479 RepID=A0ABV8S7P5_9BACL
MPNDSLFDSSAHPLYTRSINTYASPGTVAAPDIGAAQTGSEYNATATNSASLGGLGGSVIIALQLANPAGSGKTLYVSLIAGGTSIALSLLSSFSATLTVAKNATLASPATVTPTNSNFASAKTSAMTASSSTSAPSGGTSVLSLPLVAGQVEIVQRGNLVVPPNNSITVTLSASLSVLGVLGATANLMWWEG